jgi:tetratricopeptide (TPR) repeat protein
MATVQIGFPYTDDGQPRHTVVYLQKTDFKGFSKVKTFNGEFANLPENDDGTVLLKEACVDIGILGHLRETYEPPLQSIVQRGLVNGDGASCGLAIAVATEASPSKLDYDFDRPGRTVVRVLCSAKVIPCSETKGFNGSTICSFAPKVTDANKNAIETLETALRQKFAAALWAEAFAFLLSERDAKLLVQSLRRDSIDVETLADYVRREVRHTAPHIVAVKTGDLGNILDALQLRPTVLAVRKSVSGICRRLGIFVGRQKEKDDLSEMINDGSAKFICVHGTRGIGKSDLICWAYERGPLKDSVKAFPSSDSQGLLLDILSRLDDLFGSTALESLWSAKGEFRLRLADVCNKATAFTSGLDASADKAVWIILDQVESLLDEKRQFRDPELLAFFEAMIRVDRLRFLVSSRVMPKFSTSIRDWVRPYCIKEGLLPEDAAGLLRTLDHSRDLGLSAAEDASLNQIAAACHYHPLAIRWYVQVVEKNPLSRSTEWLANGAPDELYKELSAQLVGSVDETDRRVLQALSVQNEPVSLNALRRMASSGAVGRHTMRRSVEKLEGIGLLRVVPFGKEPMLTLAHGLYREAFFATTDEAGRKRIHISAAEWFKALQKKKRHNKDLNRAQLEPYLAQIKNLIKAEQFEKAARVLDYIDDDMENLGLANENITLRSALLDWDLSDYRCEKKYDSLCSSMIDIGQDDKSEDFCRKAIALAKKRANKKAKQAEGSLNNRLGYVLDERGDIEEARRFYKRAIALQLAGGCSKTSVDAKYAGNLGTAYHAIGKLDKARLFYEKGCVAAEKESKDRHEADCDYDNLALLCRDQGNSAEAEKYFEKAINAAQKGEDTVNLVTFMGDLGWLYLDGERWTAANEQFVQAFDMADELGLMRDVVLAKFGLGAVIHGKAASGLPSSETELENALGHYQAALERNVLKFNSHICLRFGGLLLRIDGQRKARTYFRTCVTEAKRHIALSRKNWRELYMLALGTAALGDVNKAGKLLRDAIAVCDAKGVKDRAQKEIRLLEWAGVSGVGPLLAVLS